MAEFELIADGLRFPEAPVVMDDGSVIVTEIEAGRITRCWPGGRKAVVATPGGGPNGLAIGPDGKLYCCNNGGFEYTESNGYLAPHGIAKDYSGGRIERIDIETGAVEILYKSGDNGVVLRGPNDIMFDSHGGFWFTDHGKVDYEKRCHDIVGIFYAKADGSFIEEVIFPSNNPNGVGLSPDGKALYAAETYTCRLMKFNITAPGKVAPTPVPAAPASRSIAPPAINSSTAWRWRRTAISASRPSANAGSASCRRRESWWSSSRPTIFLPPTSPLAAPTCRMPISPCRAPGGW